MPLNKNNFLRWDGEFNNQLFSISAPENSCTIYSGQSSVTINPLNYSLATNGVDIYSLEVISIVAGTPSLPITLSGQITWDGTNLVIPRPEDPTVYSFTVQFTFTDLMGNISPESYIHVTVSPVVGSYAVYPPSQSCVIDTFGNKTGMSMFSQLVLQYSGVNASPLTLKDNVFGDIDYIAPAQDLITCPTNASGTVYAPLIIGNGTTTSPDTNGNTSYIIVTKIILQSSTSGVVFGSSPVLIEQDCNILPGKSQKFTIPAGSYDIGLTIYYTIFYPLNMMTVPPSPSHLDERANLYFWYQNNGGVVTGFPSAGSLLVDPTPFGVNPLTIPSNAQGLKIFCQ